MRRLLSLLCLPLLACGPTPEADAPPAPPMEIAELPNGLRVWMLPNPGSGLVASNVFVGAGATREDAATAGSSHFLEHLLFNGTERRTQEELYAEVDRLGLYNNATTKREHTHYMMVAPRELLDQALDIQADMLLHSTLPGEKFEKERGIVVEEIGKDADVAGSAAAGTLDALLFGDDTPFSRPVLGTPETIAALRRDDVLRYYRTHYVPGNMLILLMGDFDPAAALATVESAFAEEAGSPSPAPALEWPDRPTLRSRPSGSGSRHVRIALPLPGPTDPLHPALSLVARILVGGEGSRVPTALREAGLATRSTEGELRHLSGRSLLEIGIELEPDQDPEPAIDVVLATLARTTREGVGPEEWARAQTSAAAEAISQREQLHYFAILQAERLWHSRAEDVRSFPEALTVAHRSVPTVLDRIATAPMMVALTGPGLPDRAEPLDLRGVDFGTPTAIAAPQPPSAVAGGEVARVATVQAPSARRLDNGLTLIHAASPTTRMLGLHVLVRNRAGREAVPGQADLLHRMLARGTARLDATAFQQELDALGASLKLVDSPWIPFDDYYTTPLFSYLRLECIDVHAEAAMRLVAELLREPRLDATTLDEAREDAATARGRETGTPSAESRAALRTSLYPGHPLASAVVGSPADLATLDVEAMHRFHADYLAPPHLVVAAVGNLDRSLVERVWSEAWPASRDDVPPALPPLPVTPEDLRRTVTVGGEQAYVRMGRVLDLAPEDRWALPIAVRLASGRMQQDLREERGWAYSLGLDAWILGDRVAITGAVGTSPEHRDDVVTAMRGFLTSAPPTVTPADIDAVVNRHLGRMRMRRVTRLGQAFRLSMDHEFGTGIDHQATEVAGLRAVTPADVLRAARRYLGPGPLVTVVAE